MRSLSVFRKYDGLRLNTPDSVRFAMQNGKIVCRIISGTKRARKKPVNTNQRIRMSSLKEASLIKFKGKTVFKFLNNK